MSAEETKPSDHETPTETAVETPSESSDTSGAAPQPTEGNRSAAMLCHLLSFVGLIGVPFGNILGPLILWMVKREEDAFVDATGKEVLNFQISVSIYGIVCILLAFAVIGLILLPILIIAVIICTIIGALKASEGVLYKYPFTIRFLK